MSVLATRSLWRALAIIIAVIFAYATVLVKLGNDWWVETAASANAPIAKVEAKVGNGAYTTLPRTDWGTYAKSISAPDGSIVTFRATSTAGATSTSTGVTNSAICKLLWFVMVMAVSMSFFIATRIAVDILRGAPSGCRERSSCR